MNIIYSYYILIISLFIALAYWIGGRTKQWRWSKYFLLTLSPFAGMVFLTWFEGPKIIAFFVLSSVGGFFAEIAMGFLAEKILGQRLWTYQKFSIKGHSSLLTLPFWGGGGIIFLILAKLLKM